MLKLLIEQTPRDQCALRERLKYRLGLHFDFQAAQRLALGRVEEEAAQSGGAHWCMLIDKMDQRNTASSHHKICEIRGGVPPKILAATKIMNFSNL